MKEFPMTTPDKIEIRQIANTITNPIIYCNQLFANKMIQTIISIDSDAMESLENNGYVGIYQGIPVYITETFPTDKSYGIIVPQYVKEN